MLQLDVAVTSSTPDRTLNLLQHMNYFMSAHHRALVYRQRQKIRREHNRPPPRCRQAPGCAQTPGHGPTCPQTDPLSHHPRVDKNALELHI